MVLHGKGIANEDADQSFLSKKTLKDKQKGLDDRTKFSEDKLNQLGISKSEGGGRTTSSTYEVYQNPFPIDPSIRRKKKIDVRKVDPRIGEIQD